MSTIDISGINKVELLKRLWKNMKPASFFETSGLNSPSFDETLAAQAVTKYIDYFCGRCIKCDLSNDKVESSLYDRCAGQGAFASIVAELKN